VFVGKRSAITSTSDFSADSLNQLVVETCNLAKAVVEDQVSGLPSENQMAGKWPDLDLYDPTKLNTEQQIELAKRAEAAAMSMDERVTNSEGADFDSSSGRVVLGNSHGFLGEYESSSFSMSVSPIATDSQTGAMQRDSWYAIQRKFAKLDSPEAVGLEAARRTVRKLGARKVATQRVPVIFDSETAGSLMGNLCSAVSGYSLYKGASFLAGQLDKPLAPEHVTVYDDGQVVGGLGSRPFDGEGLPTRKTTVVERGILKHYLLDTYSGRKLGLASTGNASRSVGENPSVGPTNFYLVPGTKTADEIVKTVRQGLYVTDLIGFGINMVTGDYSRGAAGFWIEGGELAYPVEEITIAANLKDMFAGIEMIGSDLVFRGRIASPTVKIAEMMVAGT
jgi:PmbA protein